MIPLMTINLMLKMMQFLLMRVMIIQCQIYEVGEKMRSLSEQLENCGKVDEPKEMTNPKKFYEDATRTVTLQTFC
ncbi:hypothetical protein FRX31_006976 [Thalictrum thalictroides]|uniref:Uncharacterized protein n=1 Tax=Thalictrum thalictroides TaxID=46969 RepID=A0A7J6X122_THATH|nr:hypothetical protein FRX31_006976 [Thalictrum thalictroides]